MRVSYVCGALVALAFPAIARAQVKAPVSVAVPTASAAAKLLVVSDMSAQSGSSLSSATTFLGNSCGGSACFITKAAAGGKPAVSLHLSSGKQHANEFRTGVIVAHDVEHSLDLSLNGSEILGLLCNGHGELKASPHYGALGAANQGFSWQIFESGKLVNSGHSSGEPVAFHGTGGGEGHAGMTGPMELAVTDRAAFEIVHGGQRIVLTPDDKAAIGAKTKGYVSFEDLGLRVAGPTEFALVKPALKFGVQPPGV